MRKRASSGRSSHDIGKRGSSRRQRLLEIILDRPGLSVSELLQASLMPWGTLYHHLKELEKAGTVRSIVKGRRRLLVPFTHEASAIDTSLLRSQTTEVIARAILLQPGCRVVDLIRLTGQSPRVVYYHVQRLKAAGLITSASANRYADIRATALLVNALTAP